MNKQNKQTVTAKVKPDVVKKFEALAKANGTTLSGIINQTMEERVSIATLHSELAADYIKEINNYFIETYKVAPSTNLIIHLALMNFLAQNRAECKVFGNLLIQCVHFVFRENGEPVIGDKLIIHLEDKYIEKFEKIKALIVKEDAAMDKDAATLASVLN